MIVLVWKYYAPIVAAFLQSVRLVLPPETVSIAQGNYVAAGVPYNVRVLEDWQKILKLSTALVLLHYEKHESSPNEQGFNVLSQCKKKLLLLTTNQTQQSS